MFFKFVPPSANFAVLCSAVVLQQEYNKYFSKCVNPISLTCENICEQQMHITKKEEQLLILLVHFWKHLLSFWQHPSTE